MSDQKDAKSPFGGKRRESFDLGEMLAGSRPAAAKQGIVMPAELGSIIEPPSAPPPPPRVVKPVKTKPEPSNGRRERVQVNLDPETITSAKMRAIKDHISLSELVESALRSFLKP